MPSRRWISAAVLVSVFVAFAQGCSGGDTPVDRRSGDLPSSGDGDPSRPGAEGSRPDAEASRPGASTLTSQRGPLFRAAADRGDLAAFTLDETVVSADGTIAIATGPAHAGTDPKPSGYHGGSFYNGGSYRYGIATSPELAAAAPFDSVTPSFEASTPPGTWIHVKLAARIGGVWTKDYSLGVWADETTTVRRHSVEGEDDANGRVATDTLELKKAADALRFSVVLFSENDRTPSLRAVAAIATKRGAALTAAPGTKNAWGKNLDVPKRSQMIYPNGGEAWCSPTSTSMILAYWSKALSAPGLLETPPAAAARCHDAVYDGTGNWPFNTAHASALDGGKLHGAVTRLGSFAQVEPLIEAGIPVAISVRYGSGELGNSPIASTDGHLIVVRGFSSSGDVVCNDPAFGSDATVSVTYDRDELTKVWQRSLGTTYLVWPVERSLPIDPLGAYF